jgi:hypothetical protein
MVLLGSCPENEKQRNVERRVMMVMMMGRGERRGRGRRELVKSRWTRDKAPKHEAGGDRDRPREGR